jgi:F-type H+-transporting ATPase subunit b
MDLVTPGVGLIFWTGLIFGLLLFILAKFVWKPISTALDNRSKHIEESLKAADMAREEMKTLKSDNERILSEARAERDKILLDARSVKDNIISEAKSQAAAEVKIIMQKAKEDVNAMKEAAFEDIKNQVLSLSLAVAEKVLREELSDTKRQEKLVEELLKDTNLN